MTRRQPTTATATGAQRGHDDADVLMRGPCFYCRRPMDWLASDSHCMKICRYCLRYLASVGKYSLVLHRDAIAAAVARGEIRSRAGQNRRSVEKWERMLGRPLPRITS